MFVHTSTTILLLHRCDGERILRSCSSLLLGAPDFASSSLDGCNDEEPPGMDLPGVWASPLPSASADAPIACRPRK